MTTHTDEQTHIINLARTTAGNMMINSYAGTGKTYTLEQIERAARQAPILYLVFNKRNADEARERMLTTTTVKTFNGLGHNIWQSAVRPRLKLESNKTYTIVKELADEVKGSVAREIWNSYPLVKSGVGLAKAIGYIPGDIFPNATRLCNRRQLHSRLDEEPDDLTADLIDTVLKRSITLSYEGLIDYDDQIYMPALFGGIYPKYPLALIDEYQDLNPTNHAMIDKLVKNRRLIGVGDPHQNIYGFRGAKANGMSDAVAAFGMTQTELSISFRCPSNIVRNVHWHVPNFKSSRDGGHVEILRRLDGANVPDNAVFICRLNAPLFSLAFKLLSVGRGVRIVGSDIGAGLIKIMRKFGDDNLSRYGVLDAIDEWLAVKLSRESKTAEDSAECMRVFARHGANLGQAISYAEHLFKAHGPIQLLTGHKSKGLEFSTVYHLDPHVIGNSPQDRNIKYVIQTRSSSHYYEIDSNSIEWPVGS